MGNARFGFPLIAPLIAYFFARLAGGFELVAGLPFDGVALFAGEPAEDEAEARHLGVAAEVPVGVVLVGGLVVVMLYEVLGLRASPGFIVSSKRSP